MNDTTVIAISILVIGSIPSLLLVAAFWVYAIGTYISVKEVSDVR